MWTCDEEGADFPGSRPEDLHAVARSSYAWERQYRGRTAVERVDSRLDVSFGFEKYFIRWQKKMEIRGGLALCVMLAVTVGRIKEGRQELIRSLVRSPVSLDKAA